MVATTRGAATGLTSGSVTPKGRLSMLRQCTPFDHLSDTEAAYIAGMIDGEGSVACSTQITKNPLRPSKVYRLRVRLTMTHEPTVRWLADRWGVGVARHQPRGGHRPAFSISLCGNRAAWLLRRCHPWLITKRALAEIGMEFEAAREAAVAKRKLQRTPMGRFRPRDPVLLAHLDTLIERSKELNKRWAA